MSYTAEQIAEGTNLLNKALLRYIKKPNLCSMNKLNGCAYNGEKGNVCVFAFIVKPASRSKLREGIGARMILSKILLLQDDFKKEFQNAIKVLSGDDFQNLQRLHDAMTGQRAFYCNLLNFPFDKTQLLPEVTAFFKTTDAKDLV
jgi:hypothetical protein